MSRRESGPEGPDPIGPSRPSEADLPAARDDVVPGDDLDERPPNDPAHRTARWVMVLAPVVLVVVVLLLLRLSTG